MLEESLKIIIFQTFWLGHRHLSLDQVTQSPIQPGCEHIQGWSIHNSSEQSVALPHHPQESAWTLYVADIQPAVVNVTREITAEQDHAHNNHSFMTRMFKLSFPTVCTPTMTKQTNKKEKYNL